MESTAFKPPPSSPLESHCNRPPRLGNRALQARGAGPGISSRSLNTGDSSTPISRCPTMFSEGSGEENGHPLSARPSRAQTQPQMHKSRWKQTRVNMGRNRFQFVKLGVRREWGGFMQSAAPEQEAKLRLVRRKGKRLHSGMRTGSRAGEESEIPGRWWCDARGKQVEHPLN